MNTHYNTIIIGAGPSGLISAIQAKEKGENILILEKNSKIGRKLLITGKGRCNITNYTTDIKQLISQYKDNPKFLFHAFSVFSVQDTIEFFNKLGVQTKTERGNRVFPVTDSSLTVIDALYSKISSNILTECEVIDIEYKKNIVTGIKTNKGTFTADKYILATGGKSYPLTGSNGFGFELAKKLGHTVTQLKPALVPILLKDIWLNELAGLSLKNVSLNIFQNNKKVISKFGEMLFTHEGISGPIVIDVSREIGDLMEKDKIQAYIDLKPALDFPTLKERINRDLVKAGNREMKNSLDSLLPKSLIPVVLKLSNINLEDKASQLSKEKRTTLLHLLKEFPINIDKLDSWDRAIVTAGGISTKEIDPKTMKSLIINNLYFAGEIIDVYGPTGGYNLQMCWSTGYLAGIS